MNRHSRSLLTILIVAILLSPILLSRRCSTGAPTTGPLPASATRTPVRGGTLTATVRSEPRTFNRMAPGATQPAELFTFLTQAKLVRVNRVTGELEPGLAARWTTDDGLTYRMALQQGVKWSDGTPFTSADVTFSFAAAYLPGGILVGSLTVAGKPLTVEAPDAHTVLVTFPERIAPGLRLLDNMPIYPRHKLEAPLRAGKFHEAWSGAVSPSDLAGLGPFVLSRYEPGQRLIYDRNPHYWRKDERGEQLPYLDRIVLEIVPQQSAEILRLQSGQSDLMQQQVPAADIAAFRTLADAGKLQLVDVGVSTEATHFVFNMRPEKFAKDPRGAWLGRKEFRQAISHAVDREAYANAVFLGEAVPVHGPVTPGNQQWFWPSITRYEHSVEKARGLLTGLGLTNRDEDEWLEDSRGNDARFTLEVFAGASDIVRGAEIVRDDLRKIGIALDVVPLEANTVIEHVYNGKYDAAFVAFQLSDLDPALSQDFWLSSGQSHMWNPSQAKPATDWEAEMDALLLKQAATENVEERKRLFVEAQRIFAEHLPMLHFAAPRLYIAASARVVTMTPGLLRPQVLWNPEVISVAPAPGRPAS